MLTAAQRTEGLNWANPTHLLGLTELLAPNHPPTAGRKSFLIFIAKSNRIITLLLMIRSSNKPQCLVSWLLIEILLDHYRHLV